MDFKKHCLCEFSKYVEFKGDYVVTSDMTPRIHEAIVLGPVGNLQATQKVFCLETGLVLKKTRKYDFTHAKSSNKEN